MKFSVNAQGVLFTFAFCVVLNEAPVGESTYVPMRCSCPATYKAVRGPFTDLTVISKGPHCRQDEIIVRLKRNDKEVCLSPEGRQGRRLLKCWNRIKKNGGKKTKCLRTRGEKILRQRKRHGKTSRKGKRN